MTPTEPRFAERYRAIDARDRRFDGQFVTAVRSTGIYCRPSCPARTPKPENVTFYLTSAAAHEAGYRACRRCLPEAVPGTPAWDLRGDLAGRAMRLVADGVVDREGVDGLARRLGYTPRHVHRVLVAELGAGPLALARALRAQTARTLLVGTDLRLADVAFAAGFGSIRQFNDTVAEVFRTTPSELRARGRTSAAERAVRTARRPGPSTPHPPADHALSPVDHALSPVDHALSPVDHALRVRPGDRTNPEGMVGAGGVGGGRVGAGGVGGGRAGGVGGVGVGGSARGDETAGTTAVVDLTLPFREPYDARGVLTFLAARAVDGVEVADLDAPAPRYARTLHLPHGPGSAEVVHRPATPTVPARLDLRLELTSVADLPTAVARVRRLLDLDADPVAVDDALAADPSLAPLVAATPGVRVPGAVDPHELVVRALVGQQVSVAAARTHLSRLAAATGTPFASRVPGLVRLFPTAAQVAADDGAHLRGPARRAATVVATARALAEGDLVVDVGADGAALRAALVARPGIGPWTAGYVAMRVLGDPDVLLDGDVALVAGARAAGLLDDVPPDASRAAAQRALAARAAVWAPWRSYAAMHLWRAAAAPRTPDPTAGPTAVPTPEESSR